MKHTTLLVLSITMGCFAYGAGGAKVNLNTLKESSKQGETTGKKGEIEVRKTVVAEAASTYAKGAESAKIQRYVEVVGNGATAMELELMIKQSPDMEDVIKDLKMKTENPGKYSAEQLNEADKMKYLIGNAARANKAKSSPEVNAAVAHFFKTFDDGVTRIWGPGGKTILDTMVSVVKRDPKASMGDAFVEGMAAAKGLKKDDPLVKQAVAQAGGCDDTNGGTTPRLRIK